MHVAVIGASGSGKTAVAARLAPRLGWELADADDFHSPQSIAKMSRGIPLDDEDRSPWLGRVAEWMRARDREGRSTVVACSALKRRYRDALRADAGGRVVFVHLAAPGDVLGERMRRREHFMPEELLASQLETLEPLAPDEDGFELDARRPLDDLVAAIASRLPRGDD